MVYANNGGVRSFFFNRESEARCEPRWLNGIVPREIGTRHPVVRAFCIVFVPDLSPFSCA